FLRLLVCHATLIGLAERPVVPRELARAEDVFDARAPHSYGLDLADLSDQSWSLLPGMGDFLVDVHTRRFSTLTYTRSAGDAEDISLFDRRRKKNIALYASVAKLEARGRFYSEDDLVDYDVLDYNVDASFDPEREWVEGRARLKVRVRAHVMQTMSLRLAASLALRGVAADSFGRLLGLRVRDQDLIIVNFPEPVPRDTEFTLAVSYAGRLEPQQLDREAIALQRAAGQDLPQEGPVVLPEPRFIYSNRTYWYPQSTVSDYATATLKIAVAEGFNAVATGELTDGPTVLFQGTAGTPRQLYVFTAGDPVRYLGCIISRFTRAASLAQSIETVASANKRTHGLPRAPTRASRESVQLSVEANPRQVGRGRALSERLARIASFYGSLVGDIPYPSFTVALVESNLPGGHSPPYFAILNQPLPTTPFAWRNDPAYFDRFPDFFVAHELAHQWWGHAVGWKNYHEQWLSEGLAQYFAALYAEHDSGPEVFGDIVRHLRRFAVQFSAEGPVYLGYRLGHIQNQGRVFRSIVYNKGAAVMHMLRRLVGDEAFFRGLKRFYSEWRFTKAGTDDLRRAFEAESNRSLARFFEGWIYGSDLPALEFTYRVEQDNEARNVVLRFEQRGELFDLPVTVTLNYASGRQAEKVVPVGDRVTELRVPLAGQLRSVDVNRDQAALARIKRREELRPQRR
ncbi:MAG: hypothetical protein HYX76_12120, partial [Acidobacteria bacterium]|nr:hypothetical protein [Acidobacteriota bacterium]